jgi:hypothetical protein
MGLLYFPCWDGQDCVAEGRQAMLSRSGRWVGRATGKAGAALATVLAAVGATAGLMWISYLPARSASDVGPSSTDGRCVQTVGKMEVRKDRHGSRPPPVPRRVRLGRGHLGLPDRGRLERRRQGPLDLGHLRPHARQHQERRERRRGQRPLPPVPGRRRPDAGHRRHRLRFSIAWPRIFPGGTGQPNAKGPGLLPLAGGRAAGRRHRTVRHPLPLGPAPQTLQDRSGGWQSKDTAKAFADYAGYVAEQLGDRMRHYFTINEFRSFVEGGYQLVDVKVGGKTLHLDGAPGLRLSDVELKQVRHHAVLSHGLAVQAIRARGPAGTKVGFAENIRVAVPIIDTLEYVQAAQAATRERNAGFMTVMLEGRYTDERLRSLRPGGRGRQGLRHRPGHVPARLPGTAPAGHLGGRAGERLLPLERPGQLRMGRRLRQPLRTDLRRLRGEAASWFSCSRSRRPGRFPA